VTRRFRQRHAFVVLTRHFLTNLRLTLAGPEWVGATEGEMFLLGNTLGVNVGLDLKATVGRDDGATGVSVGFVLISAGDRHGMLATKSVEEILPKDGQELKVGSAVWLAAKEDEYGEGASLGGALAS